MCSVTQIRSERIQTEVEIVRGIICLIILQIYRCQCQSQFKTKNLSGVDTKHIIMKS